VAPQDRVRDVSSLSIAKALLHEGRFLPAAEVISGLLRRDPDNPRYLELEARTALALGRHEAAATALERIIALDPEARPRLLLRLARVALETGDPARAANLVRESLAAEPSALAALLLADIEARLGRPDGESRALELALTLDPGLGPVRLRFAVGLAETGATRRAERELRRVLTDQPYFVPAFHSYAAFLARGGRLEEALTTFERALALDPTHPEAQYGRIVVARELGRMEDVRQYAESLLASAPETEAAGRAVALLERDR
jgi:tetratricopeptide (TPR) repeat protein